MIELRFLERFTTDAEEGVAKRERILQRRDRLAGSESVNQAWTEWQDVPLVKEEAP